MAIAEGHGGVTSAMVIEKQRAAVPEAHRARGLRRTGPRAACTPKDDSLAPELARPGDALLQGYASRGGCRHTRRMAGTSLLALIDDIASLLADVSVMTKVAAKKTAGVLGDDLALNAQQVTGVAAERELPVVWAVAKGSALNKVVLVPLSLAISAAAPWAVQALLMLGGLFLCYEGAEKLAHRFLHAPGEADAEREALRRAVADPSVDLVAFERDKIRGAIRTDFILSAEIIVITLGTVQGVDFARQLGVLVGISAGMTVGVYGLVAGIVKLDDLGLHLAQAKGEAEGLRRGLGALLLRLAPALMKSLGVLGTAAMFMVGGAIVAHGVPALHHALEALGERAERYGAYLDLLSAVALEALVGLVAGALVLVGVTAYRRLRAR